MTISLETKIAGVNLKNPTILAAGILGTTGESLRRVGIKGAGAVTTKSISLKAKKGHKNPTVFELDGCIVNAVGLANPGADKFLPELKIATQGIAPVIASVFGNSAQDYVKVVKVLEKGNPDLFELNISCPNVKDGTVIAKDPEKASALVKAVKKSTKIPLIVKLSPSADKMLEVAKAVEKAGASAISAINTLGPGMVIDIETGKPILANKVGGISGRLIRPIAIRCVYELKGAVKIPIIGMGGISNGVDAIEMLMAGASAVGVGSAVHEHDLGVFDTIRTELLEFMERKKYKSIHELVGMARR